MNRNRPGKYPEFRYRGARALVILHEQEMRRFMAIWETTRKRGVPLPDAEDMDVADFEALSAHVLGAACGYIVWICEMLDLPDPGIDPLPALPLSDKQRNDYLDHLLARWRCPLIGVTEEQCYFPDYTSSWNVKFCIDAMLEHAVMHPVRHRFQLDELKVDPE